MRIDGKHAGKAGVLFGGLVALLAVLAIAFFLSRGAKTPTPVTDPQPEQTLITLRLGHNMVEDSTMHQAALRFARQVEEKSQGRLKVSVHPAEQLGNDLQMLEQAREGKLDLLLTPTAKLSADIPAMQYSDLPFYFTSPAEHYAMLDGEPGQMLLAKMKDIGLVGMTFWGNGFKQFTANRALQRPEDFRDQRMRVMKSRLIMDQFETLGAKPVPIEFRETAKALADGVVDGQENPLIAIVGVDIHKVQRHLTLSNHAYLAYAFSISARTYERLPPALRDLLASTARELAPWQREETLRREVTLLEQIKAAGVTIHELAPEARAAFAKALAPVARRFEANIGTDILAKTEELRWQALPAEQKAKTLLVGLDADLSTEGAEVGRETWRGLALASEEINARGGVGGRTIRVIARDNRGMPSEGRRSVQAFADMPELVAIVGGKHSAVIFDEMNLIHERGVPYLVPWAAASKLTDNGRQPNFVFRVSARDHDVAPFLLEHAARRGRKVALVLEQSAWGRSNEESAGKWAQANGQVLATTLWFNRGDQDFMPLIAEAEKAGAGAVLLVANIKEGSVFARALAQRPAPLPVYSHWGVVGADFTSSLGADLGKLQWHTVSTVTLHPAPDGVLGKLLRDYSGRYGLRHETTPLPAFMGVAHAYDLMHLLTAAVRQAGGPDRKAVRDALEHLGAYRGAVSDYRKPFDAKRHDALDRTALKLVRFDKDGHLVKAD
ncbi:MAG: DctP family TRAP transporter solute-binding subunit [Rhodocyclaceae bacterium]|nr:DctP family TRAP transporter solute-binding subunit [Rhodocyclaceae bacterium]MDZ4214905.1 DctP family TRAP transporter solute-binding subunit [Rhodocyclaceae bacterium]